MKLGSRIPGARLLRSAAKHEVNYYQPWFDAGQTITRRLRGISEGKPSQQPPRSELQISKEAGWYYALTAFAIVVLALDGVQHGDPWCVALLPLAAILVVLAWGGLRRKR